MKKYILLLSFMGLCNLVSASESIPSDLRIYLETQGRYPETSQLAAWWAKESIRSGYAAWKESQSGMDTASSVSGGGGGSAATPQAPVADGTADGADSDDDDTDDDGEGLGDGAAAAPEKDPRMDNNVAPLVSQLRGQFSDDVRTTLGQSLVDNKDYVSSSSSKKSNNMGKLGKARKAQPKKARKAKAGKQTTAQSLRAKRLKQMKNGKHNPVMAQKMKAQAQPKAAAGRYKN